MKLQSIVMPLSEFDDAEKGDALYGKICFLTFYLILLDYEVICHGYYSIMLSCKCVVL